MITFSRQELESAWRNAYKAANVVQRTNAHRLLLFYSAECGLKAAWLRQQNKSILDMPMLDEKTDQPVKHDLNKMLDTLKAGKEIRLPIDLKLPSVKGANKQTLSRGCGPGQLNEAWRYGGKLEVPHDDVALERALEGVYKWLIGELRR